MYSRYHDRPDRPLNIPENYSGCAFSEIDAESMREEKPPASPHRIEIAKPTPPEPSPAPPLAPPPPRRALLPPPDLPHERDDAPPHTERRRESEHDGHDRPHREGDEKKPSLPSLELPSPFRSLFGKMGTAFPFSHGIGFDELLLLGLILLLARNESDSDLILWLVLLLFCG